MVTCFNICTISSCSRFPLGRHFNVSFVLFASLQPLTNTDFSLSKLLWVQLTAGHVRHLLQLLQDRVHAGRRLVHLVSEVPQHAARVRGEAVWEQSCGSGRLSEHVRQSSTPFLNLLLQLRTVVTVEPRCPRLVQASHAARVALRVWMKQRNETCSQGHSF